MQRFRSHMVMAAVLVTLGLVGMIMSAHHVSAAPPVTAGPNVTIAGPLPVPVSVEGAVSVVPPAAPLWPGTPFAKSTVVLNNDPTGFQQCEDLFTAAAGTAVILKTLSGDFNVPPGQDSDLSVRIRVPGGSFVPVEIPSTRTAPVGQTTGLYDGYAGSLEMGGLPVVQLQVCLIGVKAAAGLAAIGFVVPLPN